MNRASRIVAVVLASPLALLYLLSVAMQGVSCDSTYNSYFTADLLLHAVFAFCLASYVIAAAIPKPGLRNWVYMRAPTSLVLLLAFGLLFLATQDLIWENQLRSPVGGLDIDDDDIMGFGILLFLLFSIVVFRLRLALLDAKRHQSITTTQALIVLMKKRKFSVGISLAILFSYSAFLIRALINSL